MICFQTILLASEYAFTSSTYNAPPCVVALPNGDGGVVLHTHISMFRCRCICCAFIFIAAQRRTARWLQPAAAAVPACSLFWKDRCQSYRGRKPDSLQTLKCGPALAKALCVYSTHTRTHTYVHTQVYSSTQQRASNGGRKQASNLLSLASPASKGVF